MLNKVENEFWKDATYFDVGWLGCSLNSLLVFTFKKFFPSHLPHTIQDRTTLDCFQLSRLWSSSSNLLLNYHIEKIGNLIQKFDVFFFVVVYFLLCNDQLCLRRFASVSSMKVTKRIIKYNENSTTGDYQLKFILRTTCITRFNLTFLCSEIKQYQIPDLLLDSSFSDKNKNKRNEIWLFFPVVL